MTCSSFEVEVMPTWAWLSVGLAVIMERMRDGAIGLQTRNRGPPSGSRHKSLRRRGRWRLRNTVRSFLSAGGGYTAAAQQLMLPKNTGQYRIRTAEQARERPLADGRLDVELALHAVHVLGAAVAAARAAEPLTTTGWCQANRIGLPTQQACPNSWSRAVLQMPACS
jgi:PucR C-terminal helix-turn-helix domain